MKQQIVYEIIRRLKDDPKLMKKVKVFALIGFLGILVTGTLAIWAGVSAIRYVASSTHQVIQSQVAHDQVENIKTELSGLPKLRPLHCWGKAQSLMSVQPWIERPAIDNLAHLKSECFEQNTSNKDSNGELSI